MLIAADKYDAVLFDMDGVLTMTMKIHAACWKRMFDAYLQQRAVEHGTEFRPFEVATDYKAYVDGKLRYDGVQSFLASRGIELPYGNPGDDPSRETVCGLGNRKDRLVNEILASDGVEMLDGAVELVEAVRAAGIKTAVVSASKNCGKILAAAGVRALFDCVVDGNVASQLALAGKPAPDTFLEAARQLAVSPARAVVVEDAVSGVAAGRAGGFALVVGIDHHGDQATLRENGADIVIENLRELF